MQCVAGGGSHGFIWLAVGAESLGWEKEQADPSPLEPGSTVLMYSSSLPGRCAAIGGAGGIVHRDSQDRSTQAQTGHRTHFGPLVLEESKAKLL